MMSVEDPHCRRLADNGTNDGATAIRFQSGSWGEGGCDTHAKLPLQRAKDDDHEPERPYASRQR